MDDDSESNATLGAVNEKERSFMVIDPRTSPTDKVGTEDADGRMIGPCGKNTVGGDDNMEHCRTGNDLNVNGNCNVMGTIVQRPSVVGDGSDYGENKVEECGSQKELHIAEDDKMQTSASGKAKLDENKTADSSDKKNSITSGGGRTMEPYVGMEFKNEEAARSFYNAYARHVGFSIRSSSTQRARGGKCIGRNFVCSKEGFCQKRKGTTESQTKRFRPATREGCKASLRVKKEKNGKWVVKKFVKDHNHALADPVEAQYLRSHKNVTRAMQSLIDTCMASDLHTNLLASYLRDKAGGSRKVSTTEHDQRTNILDCRNRILRKGDVQSILDYFKYMQAENPAFFYATQVNGEGKITNFFWVDARSRMAYEHFGDAVTFDMTLKTSKYELPVAAFRGLNHHGLLVFFGFALVLDETESSFVWLFSTWLEAMFGRPPASLVTDSHQSMCAAVAQIFPGTCHRLSLHHVLTQTRDKLSHVYEMHVNLEDELCKCIQMSETVVEFEECWEFLVDRYDLRENQWVQSIYSMRHQWVPAYFRNAFFAEIAGNPWTESLQTIFQENMDSNFTLPEYIKQTIRVVEGQYKKEILTDFETNQSPIILKTTWPFEKQAADHYTRTIFARFQEELVDSFNYMIDEMENDGVSMVCGVMKFGEEKRVYTVKFDISTMRANCSCQMFEFSGILCRHVLIVFVQRSIIILPPQYILKRFTRNARSRVVGDDCHTEMQDHLQESVSLRYCDLFQKVIKYAEDGSTSGDTYHMVLRALEAASAEIARTKETAASERGIRSSRQENNTENEIDNLMSQFTGHEARQMKPQKKIRHCNICKANNHDKRNCPTLRATSAIGCFIRPGDDDGPNDQGFHWLSGEELGLSIGIPIFPSTSR